MTQESPWHHADDLRISGKISLMENHDQAYYLWRDAGFKNRILVHIDAHDDMHYADPEDPINITNFICPALREDIVREVYWVIPDCNWQVAGGIAPVRRYLQKVTDCYPGPSVRARVEGREVVGSALGKSIRVCSLDSLPRFQEEVILDIDVDFLTSRRILGGNRDPRDLPWIWPEELGSRLTAKNLRASFTNIAYSVEGGYTPLSWKFLGEELALRLGPKHGAQPRLQAMDLMRRGALATRQSNLAAAQGLYQKALLLWPESAAPAFLLAHLYLKLGQPGEARMFYQRALALDASYRTAYNSAGLWYYCQSRLHQAAAEYHRTLALNPEDAYAMLGLGRVALRQRRWVEAEEHLQGALAQQADLVDAHRALGEALARQGRRREAMKAYEKSLLLPLQGCKPLTDLIMTQEDGGVIDPDHCYIHGRLARLYDLEGERSKAINCYRLSSSQWRTQVGPLRASGPPLCADRPVAVCFPCSRRDREDYSPGTLDPVSEVMQTFAPGRPTEVLGAAGPLEVAVSGIVGVWNLDGQPLEEAVLARMSATLVHQGPDGEGRWLAGPVGLACQLRRITPESLTETQPLVGPSGSVLVFDGRLDNRKELLSLLNGEPGVAADSPDPALVLALFAKVGERFPEYLHGDFALGIFDPSRRRLILARDAIGVRQLYYHQTGKTFLFASQAKAILAHPLATRAPNDDFLADFFAKELFCPQEGHSFFQDIFTLVPGHVAVLDDRGLSVRRYWDFDLTRKIRFRSFPEYAEAFRDLFKQAVLRRLRSTYPVAVLVSGGLDSSAILCMAEVLGKEKPQQHLQVLGVNFHCPDGSAADEGAYIRAIERKYGSHIERVPIGDYRHVENLEEELWHSEVPYLECEGFHRLFQRARQHGARVALHGLGGDEFLSDTGYLFDLVHRLDWLKLWRHVRESVHWGIDPPYPYGRSLLKNLMLHHFPEPVINFLRQVFNKPEPSIMSLPRCSEVFLRRALRPRKGAFGARRQFPTIHSKTLYELARSENELFWMRLGSNLAAMNHMEMAYPFLDRDLLSFLMVIPGEAINWRGVPKGILRGGLRDVLPHAIASRRCKGDFTHLANAAMVQDYFRVIDVSRDHNLVVGKGYVHGEGLLEELEELRSHILSPNILVAKKLSCMLSLNTWIEVFFGDQDKYPAEGNIP